MKPRDYFVTLTEEETKRNLKRVRQLFSALCSIAGIVDCTIESITIKAKGDPCRYKAMGETRTIERCS